MKCETENCKNEARPGRKICNTCKSRKYKRTHPLEYWFNLLRCNARRRGKVFTLTIDQFKMFCQRTGYDKLKGRTPDALSVDRVRNEDGYTADNIQAITLSANVKKERNNSKSEDVCPF